MNAKSGPTSIVMTEGELAALRTLTDQRLQLWLEASGPMLKLTGVNKEASDLIHAYRTALTVAAGAAGGPRGQLATAAYGQLRQEIQKLLHGQEAVGSELRSAVEQELRLNDAFVGKLADLKNQVVRVSAVAEAPALTEEAAAVLGSWAQRVQAPGTAPELKATYQKLLTRMGTSDRGWALIADIALDRSRRFRGRFPGLDRTTYRQNPRARALVEDSYLWHGKGELHEGLMRNSPEFTEPMNAELRAAAARAPSFGPDARVVASVGELKLGRRLKKGEIGGWRKFSDNGVLIVSDWPQDAVAAAAKQAGAGERVDGVARATAAFEGKAEAGVSDLPAQLEREVPRMTNPWAEGRDVYVRLDLIDGTGKQVTKTYLLMPPDSKAGLTFYGIGTSNAHIALREELIATQGALATTVKTDLTNKELADVWLELFWAAFDTK
ncbi:hypothetical protein AB0C70_39590 [Streptomyces sp. NPDC048564]|uniref:hypothetical protein n=1 Tax=Streptomyces sp. NPDC048564 TaxID=3155760 RepID=UPI003426D14F